DPYLFTAAPAVPVSDPAKVGLNPTRDDGTMFSVVGPIATVAPARVVVMYPTVLVGLFRVMVLAVAKLMGVLPNNWPLNVNGLVRATRNPTVKIVPLVVNAKLSPPRLTGLLIVTPPATVVWMAISRPEVSAVVAPARVKFVNTS